MYKIVTSGKSKVVSLNKLSRHLYPSSEIYSISDPDFLLEVYLGVISHQTLVLFATDFAHYALKNYAKKIVPEAETCIRLTRKWLEDRESVSNEELRAAANAADAAHAAADADAYTAAAYTAAAAAAYTAAAAYAAAAYAAADAADAANAAGKDKEGEFKRQGTFILDFLKSGNHLFLV